MTVGCDSGMQCKTIRRLSIVGKRHGCALVPPRPHPKSSSQWYLENHYYMGIIIHYSFMVVPSPLQTLPPSVPKSDLGINQYGPLE